MSITSDHCAESFGFSYLEEGGVCAPQGFAAAGIHAGFRANPSKRDLALVVADEPVAAAGMFTTNVFCAAPVRVSRAHLNATSGATASDDLPAYGTARAVVINSGNANAATGDIGLQHAERMAAITAEAVGCPAEEVLVASTGVIGVHLPLEPFESGMPLAKEALSASAGGGHDAACAIMTTDTMPKECAVRVAGDDIGYPGCTFTVGGMAKGSGMIMPSMATMIAVITTDAPLLAPDAAFALKGAVEASFNKVTVDSDTSTNDTCFLLASGAAAKASSAQPFGRDSDAFRVFQRALLQVCTTLARAMAGDGEGATRLVTVTVKGAASAEDADIAARTVANSPLVKTAIFGHDANWGRIAAALGRSGARFSQENVDISIMGLPVCEGGLTLAFDEEEALRRFEAPEIPIVVDLGEGNEETTVWTCDLTHDYVTINGDYRT